MKHTARHCPLSITSITNTFTTTNVISTVTTTTIITTIDTITTITTIVIVVIIVIIIIILIILIITIIHVRFRIHIPLNNSIRPWASHVEPGDPRVALLQHRHPKPRLRAGRQGAGCGLQGPPAQRKSVRVKGRILEFHTQPLLLSG